MRSHAGIFQAHIGGHEAHFVDSNPPGIGNGRLQLLSQFGRPGLTGGKRVHEFCQLLLTHLSGELYARQTRCGQQLGELLFRRRPFQWHTIQQQLRSGRSEQQTLIGVFRNGGAQLVPGDAQLLDSSNMLVTVEACKFQEDIQTADKSSPGGGLGVHFHRVEWHVIPVLQRGSA